MERNMHATTEEPVPKQWIDKHTTTGLLLEKVFSIWSVRSGIIERVS
jgi:hypothetical protein